MWLTTEEHAQCPQWAEHDGKVAQGWERPFAKLTMNDSSAQTVDA
jgi:hypothetical protein